MWFLKVVMSRNLVQSRVHLYLTAGGWLARDDLPHRTLGTYRSIHHANLGTYRHRKFGIVGSYVPFAAFCFHRHAGAHPQGIGNCKATARQRIVPAISFDYDTTIGLLSTLRPPGTATPAIVPISNIRIE